MTKTITVSEALAFGALDAGVQLVTGYPGSPSTDTLEALLRVAPPRVHVEWAVNEKSAFDSAFGASLAGAYSLLCVKSVGLNVALDSLMVGNLAGGPGGFVILTGDDPGGWGSQNEEDSRPLAAAAEVPLVEPTSPDQARATMRQAFELSERFRLPVVCRITRALTDERIQSSGREDATISTRGVVFDRQPDRFNVLPIHVVDLHRNLHMTLKRVEDAFGCSALNGDEGQGVLGVIAAGHAYHKLIAALADGGRPPLRILRLGALFPLPVNRILEFLAPLARALVLEEVLPFVEQQVRAVAQRAGLCLPIAGRHDGVIPDAGELFAPHILDALGHLLPDWQWPTLGPPVRHMPSRQPLCDDCPYIPAFEALLTAMNRHGGRDSFIVTGETGCMVRGQLPPWEIMDAKYAMGSSIGLARGLALAGVHQRLVALSGDSALLHSGLGELIDAVQSGVRLLLVVLANETTALSGGQPHPATAHDAYGHQRQPVDLAAVIRAAGTEDVRVVDPHDSEATQSAFEEGLAAERLAVVIVRRACPRWETPTP